MSDTAKLDVRSQDDVCIVRFRTPQLRDRDNCKAMEIEFLLLGQQYRKIVINFEGVEYLSSLILGALVTFRNRVIQNSGAIRICCVESPIDEMFRLSSFDRLFDLFEDEASALEGF